MNFRTNMDFAEDNLAINENRHAQLQDENIGSAYVYKNSVTIDFKNPGETQLFLTDENGNITGLGVDYCADEVKAGESCTRTVDIYQNSTILSYTKNILIFTSPTTLVEE